ncbi:formyl transferase [Parazoarcus communis]|uniref:Formyl transferase n=1 Tax=Parazoarcus communis TaxID=41977 RepID=A0A2U8GUW7_9RHOO|nr:formyltransferase family protein [Parazoarcus communis]AWI77210.1 formyl transferase [Parazoarcus communis]
MRIVFIGTVNFSLRALERLLDIGADVVGVCTSVDTGENSDYADLSEISRVNQVPCLHVSNVNSAETLEWIRAKRPDVIFCLGWSRLLKRELLELAPMGVVGFHPALLPANRGRHPIIWALVLGLEETGSSFFFMNEGADSGPLISRRSVPIHYEDDAGSLYERITACALNQLEEFVPCLADPDFPLMSQDDALSNTWRKRGAADGRIDWRMPAEGIYNLIRGLTRPYVGAHFDIDGRQVKVWKSEVVRGMPKNIEPGKIVVNPAAPGVVVKCGVDAIRIIEMESGVDLAAGRYL